MKLQPYDYAAASVIIEEAGGRDHDGGGTGDYAGRAVLDCGGDEGGGDGDQEDIGMLKGIDIESLGDSHQVTH